MNRKYYLIFVFFLQISLDIFADVADPRIWGFWMARENVIDTSEFLKKYSFVFEQIFPTEKIDDEEYIGVVTRNDGGALDVFCISSIEKQSDNQFLLSMYSTDYYRREVLDTAKVKMYFINNNTVYFDIISKDTDEKNIFDIHFCGEDVVYYRARSTDTYINYFLDTEIKLENFSTTHTTLAACCALGQGWSNRGEKR